MAASQSDRRPAPDWIYVEKELRRRSVTRLLLWEEYRAALLENPDAIEVPAEHIVGGSTIVAEKLGETVGFAVVLPRPDGNAELDGLFVEPSAWRRGWAPSPASGPRS